MNTSDNREDIDASVIAPHLLKSGLRIHLQTKPQHFEELIESRIVTRPLLEEYGFVLIDNYHSTSEKENGEDVLKDDTTIQFIHRDLPPSQGEDMNIVYLRFPPQEKKRGAYTVLGDAESILRRFASFVLEDMSPLPSAMKKLREKIQEIDIDALSPKDVYTDQKTWSENVFVDIAQTVRGKNYHRIHELYNTLQSLLYKHVWQPDQLLIWDDTSMVHWRVPFKNRDQATEGGYIFRKKMLWEKESSQLVTLD